MLEWLKAPGKRVYAQKCIAGSNPALSALQYGELRIRVDPKRLNNKIKQLKSNQIH